jgi:paraquat-inducible protein B
MSRPRPNFSTYHRLDLHITSEATLDIAELLSKVEAIMAKNFETILQAVRSATDEIKQHRTDADAAEVQEDLDALARDEANARTIAELQARIDSGTLSDQQTADAEQAIAELREAAGLSTAPPPPPQP